MKNLFLIIILALSARLNMVIAQSVSVEHTLKVLNSDSAKCNYLNKLMESEDDNYYLYNDLLIKYAQIGEKNSRSKKDKDIFLEFLADAHYNKGFHHEEQGDTGRAMKEFNISAEFYKHNGNLKELGDIFQTRSVVYEKNENYDLMIFELKRAEKVFRAIKNKEALAGALNSLGQGYSKAGDYLTALSIQKENLQLSEQLKDSFGLAKAYNNIGILFEHLGNIEKSLENKLKSLRILELSKDKEGLGTVLNNVALLYNGQEDYENALRYYNRSLDFFVSIKDTNGLGLTNNNIGSMYVNMADDTKNQIARDSLFDLALKYLNNSLKCRLAGRKKRSIALAYHNLGRVLNSMGDEDKGFEYYTKAYEIRKAIEDKHGICGSLYCLADLIYYSKKKERKNLDKARLLAEESLLLAKELNSPYDISASARILKRIYKDQKKFDKSLEMYELYVQMRDSINNDKTKQLTKNQQFKYEWEKHEDEIRAEQEKKNAVALEEKKKQKIILYSIVLGLVLVIGFSISLYRRFKITNKQKQIIENQKEKVDEAFHLLHEKNKEVMDSIHYAARIQRSLITGERYISKYLNRKTNR